MQDPGALEAVHRPQLREAQGQLPVAVHPALVDRDVEGAIHRLQLVLHPLDVDRRVHAGLVVLGVPARLPEVELGDVGGEDEVVAALQVLVPPVVLGLLADEGALRVPQHQAGPGVVRDREEVQLAAELAVVAALGFLQTVQVPLQLLPGEEGVAVDALHLRVAFLALPVGLGRGLLELERLDVARGGQVGAEAEVDELAHRVALHLGAGLLLDELALQRLALAAEQLQRFRLGNDLLLDRAVLLDDVGHPLLDGREVLGRERTRDEEVVEESFFGGGTDPALGLGEQLRHRRRQQVGGGVAVDLERGIGRLAFARRTGVVRGFRGGDRRHLRVQHPDCFHLYAKRRGRRGWN